MSQFILLRGARQVLTLHGPDGARRGSAQKELSVIQDGSVLISDGVVKSVGSTRRIENLKEARAAAEIDVHDCVVMPGFVDPGLSTTSERGGFHRRGPKKSREIYDENLELMRSCLQHGTLTVEMKANEPGSFPSAVPLLRQLSKIGDNPVGMIRTWKVSRPPHSEEEMREFLATIEVIRKRRLVHFIELVSTLSSVPLGMLPFGPPLISALEQSGIPIKLDCSTGAPEEMESWMSGLRPACVTCSTWISEAAAAIAATLGRVVMFSPGSDIAEACGPGMRQVVDCGGAVALTSGYNAISAPGYSMQIAIARAVGLGRLSIEEAITAATVNSAYALGQGSRTGTIEVGRQADLTVLAVPDYHELPRQFGINQVRMAVRAGQVVFNRGRWKMESHVEPLGRGMRTEHLRRARSQAS